MKQLKTLLPAALLLAALTGCASTGNQTESAASAEAASAASAPAAAAEPAQPKTREVTSIDSKKEVAYKCGPNGNNLLHVMYGIQGTDVVVAQVKYQDKLSPNLFLLEGQNDQNVFIANGISWSTAKADAANIDKVDGNTLAQTAVETVNGQQQQVSQVVTQQCKLDKAATAKLNKAAKK